MVLCDGRGGRKTNVSHKSYGNLEHARIRGKGGEREKREGGRDRIIDCIKASSAALVTNRRSS